MQREEVLQICFWYQGEGLGDVYAATNLETFLHTARSAIEAALDELVEEGHMRTTSGGFRLTETGRKRGGRLFAESFAELQQAAHGECRAGADCCDGEDHDHEHSAPASR